MRAQEAITWTNISATPANFQLCGGTYGIDVSATFGGGSVTLKRRSQDGVTFIPVLASSPRTGCSW
jgi:hypothetical protein